MPKFEKKSAAPKSEAEPVDAPKVVAVQNKTRRPLEALIAASVKSDQMKVLTLIPSRVHTIGEEFTAEDWAKARPMLRAHINQGLVVEHTTVPSGKPEKPQVIA